MPPWSPSSPSASRRRAPYLVNDVHDAAEDRVHPRSGCGPSPAAPCQCRWPWGGRRARARSRSPSAALCSRGWSWCCVAAYLAPHRRLHAPAAPRAGGRARRRRRRVRAAGRRRRRRRRDPGELVVPAGRGVRVAVPGEPASATPNWSHGRGPPGARATLEAYTPGFLRFVWTSAATLTIVAYALWATQVYVVRDEGSWGLWSIVPFVLALFRYALDIDGGRGGGPGGRAAGRPHAARARRRLGDHDRGGCRWLRPRLLTPPPSDPGCRRCGAGRATRSLTGWGRTAPTSARVHARRPRRRWRSSWPGGSQASRQAVTRGLLARGLGRSLRRRGAERRRGRPLDHGLGGIELNGRPDWPSSGPASASTELLRCASYRAAGSCPSRPAPATSPSGERSPPTCTARTTTSTAASAPRRLARARRRHRSPAPARARRRPRATRAAFWATVGGLGLTGVVTRAAVRLRPAPSAWIDVRTERAHDLEVADGRAARARPPVPVHGGVGRRAGPGPGGRAGAC